MECREFYRPGSAAEAKKVWGCPGDTKPCSDGGTLYRTPPDCNFADCPVLVCENDTYTCNDGSLVYRNGLHNCNFNDCPEFARVSSALTFLTLTSQALPVFPLDFITPCTSNTVLDLIITISSDFDRALTAPVPEPSSLVSGASCLGCLGLAWFWRRRQRQAQQAPKLTQSAE